VTGSHIGVKSLDGVRPGHLTVLLVHVVGTGPRVVTNPEAEVLDLEGVLLVDLAVTVNLACPTGTCAVIPHTSLQATISPVAFLTFFRPRKKYQKRDLATTVFGAKIRMRYMAGVGLDSVGK
jgi:hypothetical protein